MIEVVGRPAAWIVLGGDTNEREMEAFSEQNFQWAKHVLTLAPFCCRHSRREKRCGGSRRLPHMDWILCLSTLRAKHFPVASYSPKRIYGSNADGHAIISTGKFCLRTTGIMKRQRSARVAETIRLRGRRIPFRRLGTRHHWKLKKTRNQ